MQQERAAPSQFFSISLNPPKSENVSIETFEETVDRIENEMGLAGHPRILIFHEKEARRHAHAVWSRIDAETMTAKNLPFFKNRLRDISRDLYLENDWTLPRGLMNTEARDPRNFDLAEYQQAKRMGKTGRDLKAEMQECWAVSDSRTAFEQALSERGMILARGDRRGHVAVTHDGEVLSVARYAAKKAKDIRAKLGEPENLPSVEAAKTSMSDDKRRTFARHIVEAKDQAALEKARLDEKRADMARGHTAERGKLDAGQKERWAAANRERQNRLNKGIRGLWDRVTGEYQKTRARNEAEALAELRRDREQRDGLVSAQLDERRRLQLEIQTWRSRQAEFLLELRHGRQAQKAPEPEPMPKRRRRTAEDRLSEIRQPSVQRSQVSPQPERTANSMRDAFKREAEGTLLPSTEDRLRALRERKSVRPSQSPDRDGPER
ncbi:MAG: relaxase/mobilization nuclease domain-containing protein [Minwuia sp.]|nr:relaxase/mobilization nuclease domain-containing protein [Minwuia sp.]